MTIIKNLYVDQGTDYTVEINAFSPDGSEFTIDDTQTIASKAKKVYSSTTTAFEIDVIVDVGDGDTNNLVLSIPADRATSVTPGKYRYDVIVDDDGTKTKIVEGLLTLRPSVSI
jgi:hypothetical protein